MTAADDDRFRVKPAPPKARGARSQRFVSRVLKEVSKAGAKLSPMRKGRPASTFGRGRVAAGMAGRSLRPNARRVVVKSRFVVLRKAGPRSVEVHLRYIERDGVTREGGKGRAYGPETDAADLQAFAERGEGDRHQFRFIVSPEDATEVADLRGFTRRLMQRMEVDLETRLDWVAVDHWDTDNPHTHVVLNGRCTNGEDLVIAPDYMAHGMRMRASEIATEWLGPRTEDEIRRSLTREVDQQRLTGLDRALMRGAVSNQLSLADGPDDRTRQDLLRARLQRLEAFGLAERIDPNRWRLRPDMAETLCALGEREDALVIVRRALRQEQRQIVLDGTPKSPVVGRLVAKGLMDELNDLGYVVIDGLDGRAHYLKLPIGMDLSELPVGGIVEAKPMGQARAVDRRVAELARGGVYRTSDHLTWAKHSGDGNPQGSVAVHVRRLEALRRVGIVERISEGEWIVPADLVERAQRYDVQRRGQVAIDVRSHLSLDHQVQALGSTWLDRRLLDAPIDSKVGGFAAEAAETMQRRADHLVAMGLARRDGRRLTLAPNLIAALTERELASVGAQLQRQTGLAFQPLRDFDRVNGTYRRDVQLVSGRFAMIDDGKGFSLVPWRSAMARRLGQAVAVHVEGRSEDWALVPRRAMGL